MIKCDAWPVAVCTWSLQNDLDKIRILVEETGLSHVHLALAPALEKDGDKYLARVEQLGLKITAGMMNYPQEDYSTLEAIRVTGGIVPDDCWQSNKEATLKAIDLAARLGLKYLTLHFGFIDLEDAAAMARLIDRTKTLADYALNKKVVVLMETGQETADELRRFLEKVNHKALAVNFDPANIILYDKGNPIEAVQILAKWVRHIHIKDATATAVPGTWGAEVPWGHGQVDTTEFLRTLKKIRYKGALAVEREAGDDRLGDIRSAIRKLTEFKG